MSLCPACEQLTIPALVQNLAEVPDWWEQVGSKKRTRGMIWHRDATQLSISAASGCPLCVMIKNSALQLKITAGDQDPFDDHLIRGPIYLRPNIDPLRRAFPQDDVAGALFVRGFKVFVNQGILAGQIQLFALKDSPAALSCNVTGRPPLTSSDSPEAFDLIERCIARCVNEHQACKETFSGAIVDESRPPVLPTRVIHVGAPNGEISPRLFETKGETGYYCSLSHCWGSGANRIPLLTTKATLQSHMTGIPWDTIPRAYQDAITTTHRLGFEYIWIDSLCIIQDSLEDWLHESKRMGTVYENARLTIAASHASDSSQPCFFKRCQLPTAVELPHFSRTGEREGSIFAAPMPTDYASISPEDGPLATRAWATQEWLLSRRMIFYTAGSLAWSCKVISQRETGGSFHSTARNPRWKNLIEKYSARSLTRASDRLIALEGLRTEMGIKRVGDTYCFGLWKHSMPDQLLWFCKEPAERTNNPLKLPTWTWASSMHGVRFLDKTGKNVCNGFQFDEASGTLIIHSALRTATIYGSTLNKPSAPIILPINEQEGVRPDMLCDLRSHDGTAIGWGVFDEERPTVDTNVFCLWLMSRKVTPPRTDSTIPKYYQDFVLLLQKLDGFTEMYQRIGVGSITGKTTWFHDLPSTKVYVR